MSHLKNLLLMLTRVFAGENTDVAKTLLVKQLNLMYVCPCIIHENEERYQLDATILFIIINNSTCFGHLYAHLQEYIGPQPQHLVLNTICSCIQPIYSWRWAYRCPKYVELFIIINKLLHQVGVSRHETIKFVIPVKPM